MAIVRGIEEEFGIASDTITPKEKSVTASIKLSPSYPMLVSSYTTYEYDIEFNVSQYSDSGYTEEQEDKTTYWHWHKLE